MRPAVVMLACCFLVSCGKEPTYKGMSYSQWLQLAGDRDPHTVAEAAEALCNFGEYRKDETLPIVRTIEVPSRDNFLWAYGADEDRRAVDQRRGQRLSKFSESTPTSNDEKPDPAAGLNHGK